MTIRQEFIVNDYITLKLEDGVTNIYVKDQLFKQCKFLLLNILVERISSFDEIESIDEAAKHLDNSLEEDDNSKVKIPAEVEFWGHWSNIQVWAENNYNSRLLYRNLAFPLLYKLTIAGEPLARKVYKEEIARRFSSGTIQVCYYLIIEGFLGEFENEELDLLKLEHNSHLRKILEDSTEKLSFYLLLELVERYQDLEAKSLLKSKLVDLYEKGDIEFIRELKTEGFYNLFDVKELKKLIFKSKSPISANFLTLLKKAKITIDYIFHILDNFEKVNYSATKDLLFNFFEYGYVHFSEHSIENVKEDFSEKSLSEFFKIYLDIRKIY